MRSDVIGKFFIDGAEDAIGSSETNFGYAFLACAVLLAIALSGAACAADVAKVAEPCAECHGEGGASTEVDVPTIAGYSEEYFTQSMDMYMNADRPCVETEYRSGSRKGLKTSMCEVVKGLGEGDIQLMAEYFARQKFIPTVQVYDAEWAKTGAVIHQTKCDECHGKAGRDPDDNAGMLGGQKMSYLREQIVFVREGKRFTSKKMKRRLDALGNAEIEALVNYYGSIRQ